MKKKGTCFAVVFLLFCSMLLLSSCGFSIEEKIRMKEYEKIAEKNTINYIEQKYGYTPVIKEIKCDSFKAEFDLGLSLTGSVFLSVYDENQEREFWVYTTGEEESTEKCWDNYQYPEIEETVFHELYKILGIEVEKIRFGYGEFGSDYGNYMRKICSDERVREEYGLIHEYYNGMNLSEILQNYRHNEIDIYFINERSILDILGHSAGEFSDHNEYINKLPMTDQLVQVFDTSVDFQFFNYRDRESYRCVHDSDSARQYLKYNSVSEDDLYIYMTEKYDIHSVYGESNLHTKYNCFDLRKCNDFYYVPIGGTYCNFRKVNEEMKSVIGYDKYKQHRVYDAYYVDSDAAYVMVYVPVNAVKIENFTTDMIECFRINAVTERYFVKDDNSREYDMNSTPVTLIGKELEQYFSLRLNLHDFYEDIRFSIYLEEEER